VHGDDAAKYDDEYKSFMQVRLQCFGSGPCENLTLLIFSIPVSLGILIM
jgi:hypothetical protein